MSKLLPCPICKAPLEDVVRKKERFICCTKCSWFILA